MPKEKFVVGEFYEVLNSCCGSFNNCSTSKYIKFTSLNEDGDRGSYEILDATKQKLDTCSGCFRISTGAFSKGQLKRVTNNNNMTLSEKFALAFKGEPEKSFIRAGVMNADESLTSDGQALFLAYLLKKNGEDFKTTVIDPILVEFDKDK